MKQTAVEWLIDQLTPSISLQQKHIDELKNQAKEMEKEQTLDFTRNAVRKILDEDRQNPFNLEQYYNETYGGNNEQL
jgi:hypothetical protein